LRARCMDMRRWTIAVCAAASALFLGALPSFADGLRMGFAFDYGTTTSAFGLSAPPYFTVPYQYNTAADGIISGDLEYLVTPAWPLEVGISFKGSFAFSGWDLGSPGVYDSLGNYYYPDDVRIGANWWALAAMATAHLHLGRFVTFDGAVGYGPYSYFNVSYQDDAGVVYGPVSQSGLFPQGVWNLDWSAGLSLGFFRGVTLGADVGMMGPDFIAGVNVSFPLGARPSRFE
jgi:hypothetical protein